MKSAPDAGFPKILHIIYMAGLGTLCNALHKVPLLPNTGVLHFFMGA